MDCRMRGLINAQVSAINSQKAIAISLLLRKFVCVDLRRGFRATQGVFPGS